MLQAPSSRYQDCVWLAGLESAAPSGQAAGIAVPAGRPKQHGANINASSARSAANRIAKSLVINAMSASRQGSAAGAPAKKPRFSAHPPGPSTGPQLCGVSTPSNGKPSVAAALPAASPAAAAAALEQAAASGEVGCPKCRYAKYGCKKCRNAYVKKTGVQIPVDRSVQAAVFALLQPASGSSQQGPKSGQPVTKASQPPSASATASQVIGSGIDWSGTVRSGTQPKSAKRQSSSSETDQQQATKKQKSAPDHPMPKQAANSKQSHGGKAPVAQTAKAGKPAAASLPASSSCPGPKLASGVKKSSTAAQTHASEASARLAKRAPPSSSPAPGQGSTDPKAPAAKRSRLSESVSAADAAAVAIAPDAVQAKPSRASQRNAAADAAASLSNKGKAKAEGVKTTSAGALHRSKPGSVFKPAAVAAAATEAQKHKGSRSGASQPSRSSGAVRKPVELTPAGPDAGSSKQQDEVKGSTAAALSTVQPGKIVKTPKSAAGRQKSDVKAVQVQQDTSAVARPKQAAAKGSKATAPKQVAGRGPAPAVPKLAISNRLSLAPLPKQASKAASVPAKARTKSVASPKLMTAAKIQRTLSGKAASAAGHAVAAALDSKLGCSKCRFVPTGCKKCRAKQAGQLSLTAAK